MNVLPFAVRDVLKSLRRTPGYSLTVMAVLALTIGATTAVFSIVDGVLLKPLAYAESHRLVAIREVWKQFSGPLEVNEQHFEYWRTHARTFESMAQYIVLPANMTGVGDAAQITVARTSGSLFDVLRLQAARGRTLTPADERADRPRVAVISDACWRQRFGAAAAIVGRSIAIDGRDHTVVGVLPASFRLGDLADRQPDAFVPIRMSEEHVGWVGDHNNLAIGRLQPNVSIAAAQAELDVLQRQVSAVATAEAHEPVTLGSAVVPLTETIVGRARAGLLLLLAAIGAVLLIACSNLANLGLTRSIGRYREAAIRAALGASRARLCGRAIAEQLALSVAGGALGWWVASTALTLFVRTAPIDLPRAADVRLDATVLAFAAAVTVLTGIFVALGPAWRFATAGERSTWRVGGIGVTGDRRAFSTRNALLGLQVALSVTLLVVTSLLALSFVRLMNVDRGFASTGVLAIAVSLPAERYSSPSLTVSTYDRLLAALRALPGVDAVSTTSMLPLRGQGQVNFVAIEGDRRPRAEQPTANFRFVGPDFFRSLGMVIVRGRAFTDAERQSSAPLPALVSQKTAQRLWPHEDALGKRFSRGQEGEQGFEVVGIVANDRTTALDKEPPLMVYVPYWWRSRAAATLIIKTATDPASMTAAARRAIANVDPDIAIGEARPMQQIVDASVAGRRYQTRLFVLFGIAALAIALLGVYGVTAYSVSTRRREMNIRVALGAESADVLRMVVRQGFVPVAAGTAAGIGGALAIGGVVGALLFDVRPHDPLVIGGVAATMALAGAAACVAAARRGLVLNPAAALREE